MPRTITGGIEWQNSHNPRCGLCAHFPLKMVAWFRCPVYYYDKRYKNQRPPQKPMHRGIAVYKCYTPMGEFAWERYVEMFKEYQRYHSRKYYRENSRAINMKARAWMISNRKLFNSQRRERAKKNGWRKNDPEYTLFRHQIRHYDEYAAVWQMFEKAKREDKKKGLGFKTHLTAADLKNKAPTEPMSPRRDIEVATPKMSGSSIPGGLQQMWRKHPHHYRKRNLKFDRGDMI